MSFQHFRSIMSTYIINAGCSYTPIFEHDNESGKYICRTPEATFIGNSSGVIAAKFNGHMMQIKL